MKINNNNKIEQVEMEIENGKKTATEIIINVIERGDILYDLEEKTQKMIDEASLFNKKSKNIKKEYFLKKYKYKMIIYIIILVAITLMIFFGIYIGDLISNN